ncbi:hypothetical protein [Vibrio hyugaensis]|nr:hypothetical protein [Vibrio hyugaensis]
MKEMIFGFVSDYEPPYQIEYKAPIANSAADEMMVFGSGDSSINAKRNDG